MADRDNSFGKGGDFGQNGGSEHGDFGRGFGDFGRGFGGDHDGRFGGDHDHDRDDHHHHHHHHQICFMANTSIRTVAGEVAVQNLKIGDQVRTCDGRFVPVRWIGRQTVSSRFTDELQLPIRIRAGALGENVPCRDLVVSPGHALFVDGVLIQAGALVNGTSIVREKDAPEIFVYYHVEVDDHSLIFAEDAPAETFIDNVDRANFDNWNEYQALYPEGKAVIEMAYPRAKAYRQVPRAIRERLAERGVTLYGKQIASVA
jgi:Hint domain